MGMVNPEKCPPSGSGASRHVCTASHPYLKVASNTQIPHPRPSSKMSPNLLPLAIIAMLAMAAMSQMMDDPVKSSTADAPEPPGIPSDWMRDGVDIGPTLYTMAGATKPSAYDKFTKKLATGTVVWRDVYTGFPQVCARMPCEFWFLSDPWIWVTTTTESDAVAGHLMNRLAARMQYFSPCRGPCINLL